MQIRAFRNRKLLLIPYAVICLGIGLALAYFKPLSKPVPKNVDSVPIVQTSSTDTKTIPEAPPDLDEQLEYSTAQVSADSKHIGVLFLGYGGAGHDGGYLSDAIILAYLDVVKKKLAFIHIPRDVWVNIRVGDKDIPMKINGALAMGTKTSNYPTTTVSKDAIIRASTLTRQAVTTITGLPVDFVVTADFNGFAQAINSLKGIDVAVPNTFDDPWYPKKGFELELCGHSPEAVTAMSATMSGFTLEKQFPCRYEHLHFTAGTHHMEGETALKYGRSRHTSSDYARGVRQISIIRAIIAKLFKLDALANVKSFYTSLTRSVRTDISVDQATIIVPILQTIPGLEVAEFGLDTTNVLVSGKAKSGAFILTPKEGEDKWEPVHDYVRSKI